ncbi:MAG: ABC transporter permease [Acidobacteriia bacterium]|nr:ABC transporter permease [Terriglobia bacterium]
MNALRLTIRGLARAPVFTAIAVLSLALGIGANTAIFSLLDQVLLRTLPVKNPKELVYLYAPGPVDGRMSADEQGGSSFSYPMFRELQKTQTPFTGIAASLLTRGSVAFRNTAAAETVKLVSGNYFELLGVRAAMGRLLTEDDDRIAGGHPVVVLSYRNWSTRYGSDRAMLNQTINVNGYAMTVVGVAQENFVSERPDSPPDVFVPITMKKEMTPGWDGLDNPKDAWATLLARMKPGMTLAQATVGANAAYLPQLEQEIARLSHPSATLLAQFRAKKLVLKPGEYGRGGLRDRTRQPALLLMAMTALVLLISCANVANLQLARAAARTREIAVRLAMGASRGQLIRQLLTESCLLAVAGGALGLGLAYAILRALIASLPAATGLSKMLAPQLDANALLFCLAVSILTGILFGLYPALQSTRPDLAPSLKDQSGQSTATTSAAAFRKTLVTAQVAISLLLLVSAGLFGRTLVNLRSIDLGIRADHLLTFSLSPRLNRYTDQAAYALSDQITERLAAIPGVTMVSATSNPAIAGSASGTNLTVPGFTETHPDESGASFAAIGADYFRTMGSPLVSGREFTVADNAGAPKVAVVNETFARYFFGTANPLGRRFALGAGDKVKPDIEIVGIVKDTKYADMKETPQRVFYTPHRQLKQQDQLYFYLRTAIDPLQAASAARAQIASLDPNLPIRELKTMDQQIDENLFAERMVSTLTGAFAALATLLAALGLYGVLAYNVTRRTREIGLRMALGADAGNVRRLILREVALMVSIGTAAGLTAAAAGGKLVQSMLYEMKPWDAAIYAGSAAILWIIALAAAYIPARRATSVDPLVALRYE